MNASPASTTSAIHSRPSSPVSGISTCTPLVAMTAIPTTKPKTARTAQAAPTVTRSSLRTRPAIIPPGRARVNPSGARAGSAGDDRVGDRLETVDLDRHLVARFQEPLRITEDADAGGRA